MKIGSLVVWDVDHTSALKKKFTRNLDLEVGIILDKKESLTSYSNNPGFLIFWAGKKNSSGWSPKSSIKKI